MLVRPPVARLRREHDTARRPRVAAAIAGEDPELVLPLMEGLQGDLLPGATTTPPSCSALSLHSFDSAVEHALGEWEEFEPLAAR